MVRTDTPAASARRGMWNSARPWSASCSVAAWKIASLVSFIWRSRSGLSYARRAAVVDCVLIACLLRDALLPGWTRLGVLRQPGPGSDRVHGLRPGQHFAYPDQQAPQARHRGEGEVPALRCGVRQV